MGVQSLLPSLAFRVERQPMWMLLLLPFIGLLYVPFYNHVQPTLFGFPFFYWYQLAWVFVSALLTWLVYRHYFGASDAEDAP